MRRLPFRWPWRRTRDIGADVDAELGFHLDERTAELQASGLAPSAARAQAEREFGDLDDARRYMNAVDRDTEMTRRRKDYMEHLRQDILFALRMLGRSPAFTVAAVATLALGIGANTAIFSVVNGVLLRPLPFPEPDRLVRIWLRNPATADRRPMVSAVDLDDWRAQQTAFTDIGGWFYLDGLSGTDLTGGAEPERLSIAAVSPGFFNTFGVPAASGRLPRDDEMVRGGPDRVVVLSHGFWQRRFGGRLSVVDSTLTLGGEAYRVLGVMPPRFTFPDAHAQAWIPFSTIPDNAIPRIRPVATLGAVGRMKAGVSEEQALADMNSVTAGIARDFPQSNRNWGGAAIEPLQRAMTGAVSRSLYVLLAAVAFLMLMACVNVASLLLARAAARERELGVRLALGAGRGRVLRQLLTESLVLGLIGGAAGVVLARLGLSGLLALAGTQLPRGEEVAIDTGALLFALSLSVVTALLFGLAPALRSTSARVQDAIRSGGRGSVGGGNRLRSGLVVAQVALASMLVVGAGLMTRSFTRLLDVDAGFRPDRLVAVMFTINTTRHPTYQQFYREVIDKVRTLPGVADAAAVRDAPFRGTGEGWSFVPEGMVLAEGQSAPGVQAMFISDGYVRTIGGTMLAGREFTTDDRPLPAAPGAAPQGDIPVLVNETLATRYFNATDPIGKTLRIGGGTARIIGVVRDIRLASLDEQPRPTLYVNNLFQSRVKTTIIARTDGDPLAVAKTIREAIWSLDRDQTITATFTLDDARSDSVARPRLLTVLLGAFGILGLALGALGIYGVLAYLVSQRQREIGLRLALGAAPGAVQRMIVGRGLALTALGVAIGLAGALALGRFLAGVLYGVEASDPATFTLMAAVLVLAATIASWIPARRAAGVDPVEALRAD